MGANQIVWLYEASCAEACLARRIAAPNFIDGLATRLPIRTQ